MTSLYFQAIDMFMSSCTFFVFLSLIEYAFVNVMMGDISEIERKDRGAHMKNLVNHHKFLKNVNLCGSTQIPPNVSFSFLSNHFLINWLRMRLKETNCYTFLFNPIYKYKRGLAVKISRALSQHILVSLEIRNILQSWSQYPVTLISRVRKKEKQIRKIASGKNFNLGNLKTQMGSQFLKMS